MAYVIRTHIAGRPTQAALIGSLCVDTINEDVYCNTDGTSGGWKLIGGRQVIDLYDATGLVDISAGYTVIPWDTERQKTSDFTHSTSTNKDEVTIDVTGKYKITASISTKISSGTNRSESTMRIQRHDGVSWADIAGTQANVINRTLAVGRGTMNVTIEPDLVAGDKIRIRAKRSMGSSTIKTMVDASRLHIERTD